MNIKLLPERMKIPRMYWLYSLRFQMICFLSIFVLTNETFAKESGAKFESERITLVKALQHLSRDYQVFFSYDQEVVQNIEVNFEPEEYTGITHALDEMLVGTTLKYKMFNNRYIILYEQSPEALSSLKGMVEHLEIVIDTEEKASSNQRYSPLALLPPRFFTPPIKAIDFNVSGTVLDESGEALIGVNIHVKGSTKGTSTDFEGRFRLEEIDQEAVLVISYVGYQTQEIPVSGKSVLDIVMISDSQLLDEVVVVGYGTMRKSDLTGSVSSIKAEELSAIPKFSVLQAMQGRSAGVHVKQNSGAPGGGTTVRIRGTNSIQGGNDPLYVIDGFPSYSANPTILDPADIESIEVLKDASAIAIYGSRGSNGVIIITTKKGKAGKTKVDFGTSLGYQSLAKKMDVMNAKEYATFYNLQRTNDGLEPYFDVNSITEDFDWQDYLFNTAPIRTHSLTVSGGNEKTQFALSGNIFDQQGIIKNGSYNRYSLRFNLNHEINKRMTMDFSSTISRNTLENKNSEGGRQGASVVSGALNLPPTLTPYNDDGSYRIIHLAYPFLTEGFINPLNIINEVSDITNSNKVLGNLSFTWEPINGLYLKILGGVENGDDRYDYYRTLNYYNSVGNASVSATNAISLLNENTISYIKTFARKHNISAVAGVTYQDYLYKNLGGSGSGFLSDITKSGNLAGAATPGVPGSSYSKWVLLSSIGRVNYNFDYRYYFTFSFRADGSSRYSEGNKWGYFPSGALAWKISEEQFMKNVSWISDLKLRTSYGVTGNQAIGAYATMNNLSSGRTVFGSSRYTTFAPGTRLPGDLKWESTSQFDVGVDFGLINNKLRFNADYYIKDTRDLLNTVSLPTSVGYTTTLQNVGKIQNKGFEFAIDADAINREFQWILNGNISFNRNIVKKLYGGEDILGGTIDFIQIFDNVNILREGEPLSIFYGYLKDGYDDNGFEKYKDLDNNGIINQDDKTKIGDPNPNFIYGLNSFMSYRGVELSIFIQGSQGNDLLNATSIDNSLRYTYGMNQLREVLYNHWTPENPNAKYPKITRDQTYRLSDRLVEDGSYLRLKNIELAYNLPVKRWSTSSLEKIRIYCSLQNFITITNYSGWDPDVNSQGGGIGQGIDHNPYPIAKSYTFGVNVLF